jgi:indole-3-glycerol phosphate synthase
MGVLSDIIKNKREELAELQKRRLPDPPPIVPVALRRSEGSPLRLIAEIKARSPSAGPLSRALSVTQRARAYETAGASMISVLCDRKYFDGSYEDLREAREACALPLLCKEFIIDEVQLDAARAYGASAVLLIVRCLDDKSLADLVIGARSRDLVPIVEVFTEDEARRALAAGADHIGVNARDLDTLQMDEARAARVLSELPMGVVRAYFSGIHDEAAVQRAATSRADAALVGEILMRQDDPSELLRSFVTVAQKALE